MNLTQVRTWVPTFLILPTNIYQFLVVFRIFGYSGPLWVRVIVESAIIWFLIRLPPWDKLTLALSQNTPSYLL
jgi:hypothetical protein